MRRTSSRTADFPPFTAFVVVPGIVFLFDRERAGAADCEMEATRAVAERRAGVLLTSWATWSARLSAWSRARARTSRTRTPRVPRPFSLQPWAVLRKDRGTDGISLVDTGTERIIRAPGTMLGLT
jgi:hypothetical protein